MENALKASDPAWEGALALATELDRLTERDQSLDGVRFVAELESIGLDGERVLRGLVATGLVAEVVSTVDGETVRSVVLTAPGRLAIIHAACCL